MGVFRLNPATDSDRKPATFPSRVGIGGRLHRNTHLDEHNCTIALLSSTAGQSDAARVRRILERKAVLFREDTAAWEPPLFPGVVEFVKRVGRRYRLAIASGGRREQIDAALRDTPIEKDFSVIVSAEDTMTGKPDPAIYQLALARLNGVAPCQGPEIQPADCLVIEDSLAGTESAKAAGMTVVAVATTYPAARLACLEGLFMQGGGLRTPSSASSR